jgi:hypothetical protein
MNAVVAKFLIGEQIFLILNFNDFFFKFLKITFLKSQTFLSVPKNTVHSNPQHPATTSRDHPTACN